MDELARLGTWQVRPRLGSSGWQRPGCHGVELEVCIPTVCLVVAEQSWLVILIDWREMGNWKMDFWLIPGLIYRRIVVSRKKQEMLMDRKGGGGLVVEMTMRVCTDTLGV